MPKLLIADDAKEKWQEKMYETSKVVDYCICSKVARRYWQRTGRPPGLFPETTSQNEMIYFLKETMISPMKTIHYDPSNERCH